jgi:hypothetical protein
MTSPYTPSCSPIFPVLDDASQRSFEENLTLLINSDFSTLGELLIQQPLETLYNACDRLNKQQIENVADDIFDRFVRARPATACRLASWRLKDHHIAYLIEKHPWEIIVHAPSLLKGEQLRQCLSQYPDMVLMYAADRLESDDLVRECLAQGSMFADDALLQNAHRLSPEHFVRLLRNPSTREALASIAADEELVERSTVAPLIMQAFSHLTESEVADAAPVLRAFASMI